MCVKYCHVTPTITYLYFVFVQKKVTEKKGLSAVSKGHVVWQPVNLQNRHSGGVRGQANEIDKRRQR